MTSAHRPTWAPAKGHDDQGGARLFGGTAMASARNQTAHRRMKLREAAGAGAAGAPPAEEGPDARRRQREELAAREAEHFRKAAGGAGGALPGAGAGAGAEALLLGPAPDPALVPSGRLEAWAEDADVELSCSSSGGGDSDSEEDEEAALMAELARIKEERAAEAREAEAAARKAEEVEKEEEVRGGNPLLGGGGGGRHAEAPLGRRRRVPQPDSHGAQEAAPLRERHRAERLPSPVPHQVHPVRKSSPPTFLEHCITSSGVKAKTRVAAVSPLLRLAKKKKY